METIKVNGMSCQHCVASVTKVLEEMAHIDKINIDLSAGTVQFSNNGDTTTADIKEAIRKIGFTPED